MTFEEKLRMALAKQNMSQAALARAIDTTPAAFNQRVKNGKWTDADYQRIAAALGCQIEIKFVFPDGTVIE